ncbi:hypothetical protein A3G06_01935 [Candidatus Nomurabacteria bacterium RIFCSPLOWO2_12_FULL_46_14]|uniref:DNA 3'-5' helicase n=1 Tax=Candidatus Nomurabacteria bacterium RIFCSPLOWO2_12_FULL_46_14 TaxID=1801797 RepID=A0A1F6Y9F9_9BACT|nr:MAG: hypothetical protein A3G06_01935 [Candidatus Nomurabacteria bacterium RIFCSPLOWO2_12_FULL_46_14]
MKSNSISADFDAEYKKLNPAQREAVEAIDGPVMVVAGPGTGKTQVLALRIANILKKTDIKPDGILCLTFTNSAVEAMQQRLRGYIGATGEKVNVFTFHSFGMKVIEEYYKVLDLEDRPQLLDDIEALGLLDEVLEKNIWQYIRPRSDRSRYFGDLRSLISLLKRERITPKYFLAEVEKDITRIKNDPDNVSTRGESKGELKKEVLAKLEGLERSREAGRFFELYEETKKIKNKKNILLDYDDVLENLVVILEKSKNARADLQERYLYLLVDEHQDSNRVQNEFLKIVWGRVERPDIFVVGDDRQLIYGFSGASIDHFQGFRQTWPDAKLITLIDNYRSTQVILDASHALLPSVMTPERLRSQGAENHPIRLVEAETEEDEIVCCVEDIKARVSARDGSAVGEKKLDMNNCAILVPKNAQVRQALQVLHEEGLPVSAPDALHLFDQKIAQDFMRVLKIISHPQDSASLAGSFLDALSGVPPLEAHKYLAGQKMREFTLYTAAVTPSLFPENEKIGNWIKKLKDWRKKAEAADPISVMEMVGRELLPYENSLISPQDILNTFLGLFNKEKEKNPALTLSGFTSFLERLESYGENIPVIAEKREGVKVLTMHSAKGLEFDYVWIAHMDERGLEAQKKAAFALPQDIEQKVVERDMDRVKRKLYVAITRAKRFCALSYARGQEGRKKLATAIADLPTEVFKRENFVRQKKIIDNKRVSLVPEIVKLAGEKYKERVVSASALNNFFECGWKWYFRNLLGLPEAPSESLIFGDKVHKAIDKIIKSKQIILPADPEVAKVVGAWAAERLQEISEDRYNELPVSFRDPKFPHLNIFGRIDLVERLPAQAGLSDGSLRVTDFKTGNVKRKSEVAKLSEDGRPSNLARQLIMYSYLLQGTPKWRGARVAISRLEFLEAKSAKDKLYDHVVSDEEISLLLKDIADYDELVRSGRWTAQECHYNSYGRGGTECPYCKMAEIYY